MGNKSAFGTLSGEL